MKRLTFFSFYSIIICTVLFSGCTKHGSDQPDHSQPFIPVDPPDYNEDGLPDLSVPAAFDWKNVYIKIPVPAGVTTEDISVEIPPLKYGKKFVYSYTFDDCVAQAYGKAFCTVNKKWVDGERFYHVGQAKSAGTTPAKTLGYTDGCGNELRFAFGVAVWPDKSDQYIDNYMNPTGKNVDKYFPYLVWRDAAAMIDFGCDIYFHDVNDKYGNEVDGILNGFRAAQEITKKNIKRKIKILARPNGDNKYVTAARKFDDIVFMAVENTIDDGTTPLRINFGRDINLFKQAQYRRFTEPVANAENLLVDITAAACSDNYPWLHDFSHGPVNFQYIPDLLTALNDRFGKDGDDSMWFATLDEVYEYNYFRNNCTIEKSIENGTLTLRFSCPTAELANELQYHRDFSLIVSGAPLAENITVESGSNVYGLSNAKHGGESLLINIDCNKSLQQRAERYTSLYEKEKSTTSKEDAFYFVNRLKPELKRPLESKL